MDTRQLVPWLLTVNGTSFCLFAVPVLAGTHRAWLLALVPFALLGYSQFAVVHEAIHGNLHPQRGWNQRLGRIASVLFGSPFAFLRDAHLLHHKYNRKLGHPDLYEPARETWLSARARYLFDLFLGLYLKELGVAFLCLLPRRLWAGTAAIDGKNLNGKLLHGIAQDKWLGQTRFDSICLLASYAVSFALYGQLAPYLALALLGRALVVSFHDNAYHHGTDPNDIRYARNLYLPPALRWLLLNFNYHGVHHQAPGTPWYELPAELERRGGAVAGPWHRAALAQLSGPFPLGEQPSGAVSSHPEVVGVRSALES